MFRFSFLLVSIIIFCCCLSINAQDSSQVEISATNDGIRLNAFAKEGKVAQNRTVEFVLRLEWAGNQDRYDTNGRYRNVALDLLYGYDRLLNAPGDGNQSAARG